MKKFSILFVFVLAMNGLVTKAQGTITEDFIPSVFNQPGQEYPQVNSQG